MGLGHGRQRAGAGIPEEIRVGNRTEWAHSSDDAKGRRECDISYGVLDGISAAAARESGFTGADESAGRAIAQRSGNYGRELRAGSTRAGGGRLFAGVKRARQQQNPSKAKKKKRMGKVMSRRVCGFV